MSKSVLIIDMPENCEDCPLFHRVPGDVYCSKGVGEIPMNGKPDWCPLIRLPDHINVSPENTEVYVDIYADGWNACLDYLEGRGNE